MWTEDSGADRDSTRGMSRGLTAMSLTHFFNNQYLPSTIQTLGPWTPLWLTSTGMCIRRPSVLWTKITSRWRKSYNF